jgi:hypothetical protein
MEFANNCGKASLAGNTSIRGVSSNSESKKDRSKLSLPTTNAHCEPVQGSRTRQDWPDAPLHTHQSAVLTESRRTAPTRTFTPHLSVKNFKRHSDKRAPWVSKERNLRSKIR